MAAETDWWNLSEPQDGNTVLNIKLTELKQ